VVFFDSKTTESGREFLIIGQQWWLFPAITIPPTILVFAIWLLWQRYRHRIYFDALGVDQITDIERWRRVL
jgi:ABC-type glucose/galactose transport system permease subunit